MEPITLILLGVFLLVWASLYMVISNTAHETDGPDCEDGPVDIYSWNDHVSVYRPDANTTAITPGFFLERSNVAPQRRFRLAQNQSVTVIGVSNYSQLQDSQGNWRRDRPGRITVEGRVRVWSGEALAADAPIMSDGTSRAVLFTAGVDPAAAYKGMARSACTAAGEWVEVDLVRD